MRKVVANIGWIFFDKVFRMLIGMLVSVWIARYLGPAEFGILNYAMLFPTIFASFAGFGLTNVLMVEFVTTNKEPIKQQRILQMGLLIKLLIGSLAYALNCILNVILNRDNAELFTLINITGVILILQSSDVIETYFQAQTKAKFSVTVKLIAFGLASLARVYALLTKQDVLFLIIINIIELIIIYVLLIWIYRRQVPSIIIYDKLIVDYSLIRHLSNIAWPIMITEFFVFIYMKVDQFMIETLSTSHELGIYGAALRLSETWYFIATAVTTSIYPKIAEYWTNNKIKFYHQYQELLNVLVYTSLILAIFISFFSEQLITLLYGSEFHDAGVVLSVHIWAGIFVFIGVGANNLMIIENLQKFVLIKTILGALVNVGLNFILIPKFGALGASVATLIAYSLQAYIMNLFMKKSRLVFNLQSRAFINFVTFKKPITKLTIL